MNPTTVTSTTPRLPLSALRESSTNPRSIFNGLEELASTIRSSGVVQALIVRPLPNPEKESHTRSSPAPGAIGLRTRPKISSRSRTCNAKTSRRSKKQKASAKCAKPGQTLPKLAARLGKTAHYVAAQFSLLKPAKEPRQALAEERIGLPHAIKIAVLPEIIQNEALSACFADVWEGGRQQALLPVSQLEKWIERNVLLTLDTVPFDKASADLVRPPAVAISAASAPVPTRCYSRAWIPTPAWTASVWKPR